MKYLKKRRYQTQDDLEGEDPLTGLANLFDLGLVFIVGLLLMLFATYHLQDLFAKGSEITIMKKAKNGEMEIITKKARKIKAMRITRQKAKGRGQRLGVAYKLENGTMVYVPDKYQPIAKTSKTPR